MTLTKAQRMREARAAIHLSQGKVAKLLGLSRAAVGFWESEGPQNTFPQGDHLFKCAKLYKKDPTWLRFGDSFLEKNNVILPNSKCSQDVRLVNIPIISWELAKKGKFAVADLAPDHKEYFPIITDQNVDTAFGLHIKNDAMAALPSPSGGPTFQEPDSIAVNPEITELQHQQYGLFLQKGANEPIFRQYIVEGKEAYLKPLNSKYELIKLTPDIEILGRAFYKATPL